MGEYSLPIFVPHKNVEANTSIGQAINRANAEYAEPEMKRRGLKEVTSVGIEIFPDGKSKIYFDTEVQVEIEFKDRTVNPDDNEKAIALRLSEIRDIDWHHKGAKKLQQNFDDLLQ